ncbi:MAG TPA: hypothetical protein VMV29_16720 [Ktedonobacterales bacterium]|nr:hypothetical protein [Ktedonobacterales bacterium]
MTHVIELTDEEYATLEAVAQHQGVTPQACVNLLIEQLRRPRPVYENLDDFFRSLGATDEEIAQMNASIDDAPPSGAPTTERNMSQA